MLQEMTQGGSPTPPWIRQIAATSSSMQQYEYLDATSDDALLHTVEEPSLVHVNKHLLQMYRLVTNGH